jgi:site-specific DNA-methyltransferase (adenine-specific)
MDNKTFFSSEIALSSKSNDWVTPQYIFNELDKEFRFTLDPCASEENAKCDKYYTVDDDGLSQDWSKDVVFMNPPYGRDLVKWVEKAYNESLNGALVVCLIPSRTDTRYWHNFIFPHAEIRFLKGRLRFGAGGRSPFPSAIVIFDKNKERCYKWI